MQNRSPHSLQSITTSQKLRGACFDLTLPLVKGGGINHTGRIDNTGSLFIEFIRKVHQHLSVRVPDGRMRDGLIHAIICHSPLSGPRRGRFGKILRVLFNR